MKLFFTSSELRWAAYTSGNKLIQCYKCDANGTLSTFLEVPFSPFPPLPIQRRLGLRTRPSCGITSWST